MSDAPTPEQESQVQPKRSVRKLVIAALVLLVIALAINAKGIYKIATGQKTIQSYFAQHSPRGRRYMAPSGPVDAKVVLVGYLQSNNECHDGLEQLLRQVAARAPRHIRVRFMDTSRKIGFRKADALGMACDAGFTINGKLEFEVPGPVPDFEGAGPTDTSSAVKDQPEAQTHVVKFSGPGPGMTPEHCWTEKDLEYVLNQELKKAYGPDVQLAPPRPTTQPTDKPH